MVMDVMIEAAIVAFKEKLLSICREEAQGPLTPESASLVSQGLQEGLKAAGLASYQAFLESKNDFPDIVVSGGEAFRLKYHNQKTFESLWGKLPVTRGVYQNASDSKSHVPLDAAWGMEGETMVREVQEALCFACSFVTAEESRQLLEKTAMFHPHPTQIKRCVERVASKADKIREPLDERIRASEVAPQDSRVLAVSMDGANVLLNERGAKRGRPQERPGTSTSAPPKTAYKNAMVGTVSFYGPVKEAEEGPERRGCRYTSHMPEDGYTSFRRKLEAEVEAAERQAPPDAVKVLVCDGARSIWNYVDNNERFTGYEKIIDYFHTVEHLSLAAEALFGKNTLKAQAWYKEYAGKLLELRGGAKRVLNSIDYYAKNTSLSKARREELATQRTFFERNQQRMNYPEFRRRGLPIGSGPVEAACKSIIKTRLCRSGMRWSRPGGQRILDLRTYVKSNRWTSFWKYYVEMALANAA